MPEPRQYTQHRTTLERLVGWIPGFHGYLEKEYRRDSDALQRAWLADQLQKSKRALDALSLQLADDGKLPLLPHCDRLRAKIDEIIARIRGAWEGYTGVFDLVKVDQALLDRVYDHDVELMHAVEDFVASTETLAGMPPRDAGANPQAGAAATVGPAVGPAVGAGNLPTDNPFPVSPLPSNPESALPLLTAKLDAIQQGCDRRADLLKGLG